MMQAFVPPWEIYTDEVFVAGICIFLVWISKAVVWRIEEEAMSLRRYFTIVLAIFLLAVAVSTHLNVVCRHFISSYVAVSRQCCLLEFYPNRASLIVLHFSSMSALPQKRAGAGKG